VTYESADPAGALVYSLCALLAGRIARTGAFPDRLAALPAAALGRIDARSRVRLFRGAFVSSGPVAGLAEMKSRFRCRPSPLKEDDGRDNRKRTEVQNRTVPDNQPGNTGRR